MLFFVLLHIEGVSAKLRKLPYLIFNRIYMAIKDKIKKLADKYTKTLHSQIAQRKKEMKDDDTSHYLIYRVLGISNEEGQLIDEYQNTGRFLYKYAGSFLEEATTLCFTEVYPEGCKTKIPNTLGQKPKTFEIDFLNGTDAIEIKWRDATTDGDHITKEHTKRLSLEQVLHPSVLCSTILKEPKLLRFKKHSRLFTVELTVNTMQEIMHGSLLNDTQEST